MSPGVRATWMVGVGVAALLAGLGGGSRPAEAAFPGANGKIAYERLDKDFEILATNPDGTGTVNLTFDPARFSDDFSPAWSPDGTRIAFHATREGAFEGGYDIYVMNADGRDRRGSPPARRTTTTPRGHPTGRESHS